MSAQRRTTDGKKRKEKTGYFLFHLSKRSNPRDRTTLLDFSVQGKPLVPLWPESVSCLLLYIHQYLGKGLLGDRSGSSRCRGQLAEVWLPGSISPESAWDLGLRFCLPVSVCLFPTLWLRVCGWVHHLCLLEISLYPVCMPFGISVISLSQSLREDL